MDFTRICRSCMKKISLRGAKRANDTKIVEMFCFCLNTKVSDEDKLPQQFCTDCVNKIESSYSFIRKAQNVNITLRNLLSRIETSIIVELEHNKNDCAINVLKNEDGIQYINENVVNESQSDLFPKSEIPLENLNNSSESNEDTVNKNTEDYPDHYEENNSFDETEHDKPFFMNPENCDEVNNKIITNKDFCVICLKKFASKAWYTKHMLKEHGQKKYSCKYCPKSFTIHTKYKQHIKTHSDERNFSCSQCGKSFKYRKQMALHTRVHGDAKPFACTLCPKSYKRKTILQAHMALHQNERKHLCNVCGMSFFISSNLRTHMRVHTGEKPFKCVTCSKAFNTSSSLRRHERLHRGEAPYSCDTCAKAFSSLNSMRRHQRIHTGETPYACPWCARAFVDSWKRKVHMMRAHGAPLADIPRLSRAGAPAARAGRPPQLPAPGGG